MAYEITDEQIEQLQIEAGAHGDTKQVELCALALRGDENARRACEDIVSAAALELAERKPRLGNGGWNYDRWAAPRD